MLFRCKMCGGDLSVREGDSVVKCEYCGNINTIPKTKDDNLSAIFNRANELRRRCDFDLAEKTYERIIESDPTEAEAYFGAVLSRFGIEYVDDPATGEKVPTCHRVQYEAMSADPDFKKALDNADVVQRPIYEEEARKIDAIQKEILAISQKEDPYDVFICYKETDAEGKRTADSIIANDIYYQLTQEGYKVFYAAITLEDKLGQDYEPIIFAALNSAKVMLAIGTRPEYFKAVWVKNEWSRFLKIIKKDRTKRLFPCYKDMDAYDLPEDFSHLQALDMSKIGFMTDLIRGVKKLIPKNTQPSPQPQPQVIYQTAPQAAAPDQGVEPLLKRAYIFLECSDFDNADKYFERVLNIDPENAQAYLGKLLCDLKLKKKEQLKTLTSSFASNNNYKLASRYGGDDLKSELEGYLDNIEAGIKERAQYRDYSEALSVLATAKTVTDYEKARQLFFRLAGYKDSSLKTKECGDKIQELKRVAEEKRKNDIYEKALSFLKSGKVSEVQKAKPLFESISDYRDSAEQLKKVPEYIDTILKNEKYAEFVKKSNSNDINTIKAALKGFESILGWKDSEEQIQKCLAKIEELELIAKREREEREREEAARARAAARRKRMTMIATLIIVAIAVAVVGGTILAKFVILPKIRMTTADTYAQQGHFSSAASYYSKLSTNEAAARAEICSALSSFERPDTISSDTLGDMISSVLEKGATVTLNINRNGGSLVNSSDIASPKKGVAYAEDDITTIVYNNIGDFEDIVEPVRNGYKFNNWTTGKSSADFSGSTPSITLNVYATWDWVYYSITYLPEGGEMGKKVKTTYLFEDDDFVLPEPTRHGYTFIGWSENDEEPRVNYTIPNGSYGDRTFKAHWKANENTITLDLNGGEWESESITIGYEEDIDLPIPSKKGYDFLYWSFEGSKFEKTVWDIEEDITLVANWSALYYGIKYELDGGTNENKANKYTVNDEIVLKDPTKTGYDFQGWYTDEEFENQITKIEKGSVGSLTLYAKWTLTKYTLTYHTFGFENPEGNPAYYYITSEDIYLVSISLQGYTFDGWYEDEEFTKAISVINQGSTKSYNIYAKISPIEYTIDYVLYGGVEYENPSTYNIETEDITFKDAYKNGYGFEGWYKDEDYSETIESLKKGSMGNMKLYAKWSVIKYKINYVSNDIENIPENPTYYYVTSDDIVLATVQKTGYCLAWYSDSSFNNKISVIKKGSFGDYTLYAKWDLIDYDITYDLSGGQNSSENPYKYNMDSDTIVFKNATRTGYSFEGWYSSEDYAESVTGVESGSTGSVTVYAKWSPIEYTITYHTDGAENSSDNPEVYTIISDTIYFADIKKDKYEFLGWYTNEKFSKKITKIESGSYGDYDVYAKWTLIFDRDGDYVFFGSYPQSEVTNSNIISALTAAAGDLPTVSNDGKWTYYMYWKNSAIGGSSKFMWYIDIEYSNEKYRGVYFTDYRQNKDYDESIYKYNGLQRKNGYTIENVYWFKYEPLKWKVLYEETGETLLLCESIIDSQEFYSTGRQYYFNTYYNTNSVRGWLNDDFYNTAFNATEKEWILKFLVDNSSRSANPDNDPTAINNGNNTYADSASNDYVFLLSLQEATTAEYGFNVDYSNSDTNRQKLSTDYAKCQGLYNITGSTTDSSTPVGNAYWWLRSPLNDDLKLSYAVDEKGQLVGLNAINSGIGIVPAIRVDMCIHDFGQWEEKEANCLEGKRNVRTCSRCGYSEVELIEEALGHDYDDGVCTRCGKNEVLTRVNAFNTESLDGEYFLFGSYPQTEVKDSKVISALNTAAGTLPTSSNAQDWTSYEYYDGGSISDYMWYIDKTYNDVKYRGVYFTSYRAYNTAFTSGINNSNQDDNGYYTATVYWFKFEPIKWRILSESDGTAFILCELAIDAEEFYPSGSVTSFKHNGGTGYADDYSLSNVRKWLNDTFYNTAFGSLEKDIILKTSVDNSASTTMFVGDDISFNDNNKSNFADTNDYVFLLSVEDVTNCDYGFVDNHLNKDKARSKKATDYASCQGVYTPSKNCAWALRSSSSDGTPYCLYYCGVTRNGTLDTFDVRSLNGVAPAIMIKLD